MAVFPLQVFEGVYNNARMLHFLTAVVVNCLDYCLKYLCEIVALFKQNVWKYFYI